MIAILKREIGDYFNTMTGYIFAAVLLLFAGIYVMVFNLRQGYANFEYVLSYLSFLLIIAIPLITMKIFAEERRQKTDQLLFSLPISTTQIALGKFLALAFVILLPCAVMAVYPLALAALGKVNLQTAYSTLLAFFLLALLLASIGMLISSLCENQAAAAGICFAILLVLYYAESLSSYVTASFPGTMLAFSGCMIALGLIISVSARNIRAGIVTGICGELICLVCALAWRAGFSQLLVVGMQKLAVFDLFFSFVDGMMDLRILFYYVSLTAFMLLLTILTLEKRRWNG